MLVLARRLAFAPTVGCEAVPDAGGASNAAVREGSSLPGVGVLVLEVPSADVGRLGDLGTVGGANAAVPR